MRLFQEIVRVHPVDAVVETGTYRGTTTQHMRDVSGAPVFTVEAHARFYHYCRLRFRHDPGVSVIHGDSRRFLERSSHGRGLPARRVFFYLDAHWNEELPLNEELTLISERWDDSVVMIDDFQVPDDPGYSFDDYGGSKRLSLDCVPAARSDRFILYCPAAPSAEETGARRGCIVLATRGPSADALAALRGLRRGAA